MKQHNQRKKKIWRRKFATIAARDRQFTVRNTNKAISPKVEHKLYYNGDTKDAITCPFTGHKFIPTNPHPVPGKFGIEITGYDWVEPKGLLWKPERHKQPKRLMRYKKRYHGKEIVVPNENWPNAQYVKKQRKVNREKRNDYITYFPLYPYVQIKMSKEAYMEALVKHKTAKWERKNPKPDQDLFEKVEDWKNKRFVAEQRFRDFVVSIYDKLHLTGRFVVAKGDKDTYQEEKVADIKDINGEGHKVNELPKDSKLMKKAQKITNETKKQRPNLVSTNLKDHKQKKGRIILPEAA